MSIFIWKLHLNRDHIALIWDLNSYIVFVFVLVFVNSDIVFVFVFVFESTRLHRDHVAVIWVHFCRVPVMQVNLNLNVCLTFAVVFVCTFVISSNLLNHICTCDLSCIFLVYLYVIFCSLCDMGTYTSELIFVFVAVYLYFCVCVFVLVAVYLLLCICWFVFVLQFLQFTQVQLNPPVSPPDPSYPLLAWQPECQRRWWCRSKVIKSDQKCSKVIKCHWKCSKWSKLTKRAQ